MPTPAPRPAVVDATPIKALRGTIIPDGDRVAFKLPNGKYLQVDSFGNKNESDTITADGRFLLCKQGLVATPFFNQPNEVNFIIAFTELV